MATKESKKPAPRNAMVLGMILTKKPSKFRHRADRRPKDARRDESRAGW